MKFERIYSYNPVVDIAQVIASKREHATRLASRLPEELRSMVYSGNDGLRTYARLILAATPRVMQLLQDELAEIRYYSDPAARAKYIRRLLEKHSGDLWAAIYESAGKIVIPNLMKEYNIPQDKAEDAFAQATQDLFDSDEISRSIESTLAGKESGNSNKKTIFDRLFEYNPGKTEEDNGLQNWLNKAVELRAKTILLIEHRRRGRDVNLDAEAPEAAGNTFGDLVADPTQDEQFADVEERASRSFDDQTLISEGLHRVVKIRDFAKQFAEAKAELGDKANEMPQIAISEKQVNHLIGLAKLMVQAHASGDEVELENLNDQCDRIFGRLEQLETKDTRLDSFNQKEDQKRKRYLLPWLGENAIRKSKGQSLLQWSSTYAPPTTEELESYNLTPEDVFLTDAYKGKIEKRNEGLENKRDQRRKQIDFLDQQTAYDRMDAARNSLLPHLYRSWEYPGLDPKERSRLKQSIGGGLIKPVSELHRGIGHPEMAGELFGENADYSQMDKERLWSHLLMDAAMATHDRSLFDIKNNIKLPKGSDKVAITRFVEHVKTSPIYQIDPKFFQAKLEAFMSKSSSFTALNQRIDVYTRAGAYEQARYDSAGNKPWSELTSEDKDAMAMYVWNHYYREGVRQFRTIRDTDGKEEPTAPLARNTDVTNYLYRIRAEIERISRGEKKWVSTSTAEQANNKGHGKSEYVKRNSHDNGDHTGDFNWIQTGLWNDQGPLFDNQTAEAPQAQGAYDESELDMPELEDTEAPHLHAYSVRELVRFAQVYDDEGMHDEADLVDEVINQKLAEWKPKFSVRFVAANDSTRSKGLMFSEPLKPREVALFVFDKPARHAFWNKNVTYPLSLAFLDSEGDIVDFADLDAYQSDNVSPRIAAKYVVEAPKGAFRDLGISVGDKITLGTKEVTILRTAQKLTKFVNK